MATTPEFVKLLDISPFASLVITEDLTVNYANPIMMKALSLSENDGPIGQPVLQLVQEPERETFVSFLKEQEHDNQKSEWKIFSFVDANEEVKQFLLKNSPNLNESPAPVSYLVFGLPLSDGKIQALLSPASHGKLSDDPSLERYKAIFEGAIVGITILDEQYQIEETNKTFTDQLGVLREDLLKKSYEQLFTGDAKEKIENLLEMVSEGSRDYVKDVITINTQYGESKIIEISFSKMFTESESKNHTKYMMLTEDITNQQDTHAALLQSEKLALTGRLAASLAHEINNPLQTSIGCLGLVEEMLNEDEKDLRVYITMAMEELERSARIVKKLRDLNRKADISDKSPVDLQKVLDDVLILTKNRLYDRDIVSIFPYQGPRPVVMASEDQIRQVFLNLIMNAIDAIHKGGNIYLDIIHTHSPKGIEVKVRDTGSGIDQDLMDHLFDPFLTTKEDGVGLGLYICKQIIDDHNGSLSVESESGIGTEFSIWLPALDVSGKQE